jgi:8-oxo-dGTP pyrophosphatase MutT (NUDIX family)
VDFTKKYLQEKLANNLPGVSAHKKMMNYSRIDAQQARTNNIEYKEGAVLILLYPDQQNINTLLMLRPEYEGVHSAQVSFPGGKRDLGDVDILQTALRETKEEVGVLVERENIIGQLTEIFIPPSKFLVTPFVGWLDYKPDFIADKREVQQLIELPVKNILDDNIIKEKEIFIPLYNINLNTPYFDIYGNVVWGATAMMLAELREVLIGS